jgi:hypothetical protein
MTEPFGEPRPEDELEDPCDWEFPCPYQEPAGNVQDDPYSSSLVRSLLSYLRVGSAALNYARLQHVSRRRNWTALCLMFVRECFNAPAGVPSAEAAYNMSKYRHTSWPPPAGVPVYWTNGRFGHVVLSAGDGWCWSTDFARTGYVDKVRINAITNGWGQRYRGWSEDINGVRVYEKPKAVTKPKIDLSSVRYSAKHERSIPQGIRLKRAVAAEVGRGRMNLLTKTLGSGFREQYKLVQRKYIRAGGGTPTSINADGIPGRESLVWLGRRHGFQVVA